MAQTEIRLSEIEEHMREIAREVMAEQADVLRKEIMEAELGKLRLEMDAHLRHIREAINALAEAQKRTEERVSELAEAQRRTEERVSELAEAQRRTEERLERLEATVQALAEAQKRTEERVNELAEAQRRTEERLERLEATVQALTEAQRRTEERVNELAEAQRRTEETVRQLVEAQRRMEESLARLDRQLAETNKQVGQLANRLGLDLEVDAEEILREVLKKKGFELLQEPFPIVIDGEADVVAPVRSPEGETFWVLVEVKGRVRRSEVGDWLRQLNRPDFQERLREMQVEKPYLPYIFGLRIYLGVEKLAAEAGLGVLDYRGERLAPRPWR